MVLLRSSLASAAAPRTFAAGALLAAAAAAPSPTLAQAALDAHVHGVAELDLALEGGRLEMALRAPGVNIVGFEHAAESEADKSAVAEALAALGEPAALFGLAEAAGCTVSTAEAALRTGEDGHEDHGGHEDHAEDKHGRDEHAHDEHAHDEHAHDEKEAEGAEHTAFEASYAFDCADAAALGGVDLTGFFARFPGSEAVEARIVTSAGASATTARPDAPTLPL